jgi:DNA-binding CsgD family transcriptional regulator
VLGIILERYLAYNSIEIDEDRCVACIYSEPAEDERVLIGEIWVKQVEQVHGVGSIVTVKAAAGYGLVIKDVYWDLLRETYNYAKQQRLAAEASEPPRDEAKVLTRREKEVLKLRLARCKYKVIGLRLNISEGTVKSHARSAVKKLDALNVDDAALRARARGLLEY